MSLGSLVENIYNGNVSLDGAKQEQRKTENMLENFIDYNPIKDVYKNQKTNILLNEREFYNGQKEVLIAFEENIFRLPKPYVFGKNEWKEKDRGREEFLPKIIEKIVLEKFDQIALSEKENELLDRDFGYKNIDELVDAFDNTKTDEELDELFDKITNKWTVLKKLINAVSNITEKKRINNVIRGIEFVLNYVAYYRDASDDDESNSSCFDFRDAKGSGLKVLTPNQMLSRLPISLAQLKTGNDSEKLKNETRQLLYSSHRSKKLTKQLYKSLVDII